MTQQQKDKAQILEQIKHFTNTGRHQEAMGLYERHFGAAGRTTQAVGQQR